MTLRRGIAGVLAAAALAVAVVSAAGAAAGDFGSEGPSLSGAGTDAVGSKPQSKLWFNDGSWWGVMWDSVSGDHHIFRLDTATRTWIDTGMPVDTRSNTRSDVLWDGRRLYVASHMFSTTSASGGLSRLYRFSYDLVGRRYSLDVGYPATINTQKTETLVFDKDSTGRLWATWVQGTNVYVSHTVADDRTWATPFVLPVDGATGVTTDDISSVVAFGGSKIGLMWSNQARSNFYFAVHLDGQPPDSWQASEVALGGALNVDDHINLKATEDSRVFAAVKTSQTASSAPGTYVLERAAGGWSRHVHSVAGERAGRSVLLLDESNDALHVFSTAPESGGTIYEKTARLSAVALAPGLGSPFLRNVAGASMNDATTTKQPVDGRAGLAVVAGHKSTSRYWHNHAPLPLVPQPALTAELAATPTSGMTPLAVTFSDKSTGAPVSWQWDFGDGATSTEAAPSHTYTDPGSYTVRLTVTDAQGNSDTRERPAYVTALALTAAFKAAPTSGRVPLAVTFTDQTTGTPASRTWDFGDGTPVSHAANPTHAYERAGTYDVTLTVADAGGRTSTAVQRALITALPLTAQFTATPASGRVPLSVAFTDTTLGTPVSWLWDFGDGSSSTQRNPAYAYRFPGTYTVALQVTDAAGNTSTRTQAGLIGALPPVADFTGTPTSGSAPLSVAFRDTTAGTPTSWSWDFGDGGTSMERDPAHVYETTGTYTVTLTATDAAGNRSTKERAAYVSVLPLTADFTLAPPTGPAPLAVRFTDTSVGAPTSWSWDFGDSTRPSTERSPLHTYDGPGTYTVTLRVTDAKGDTSTKVRQNVVTATPEVVLAPAADSYAKSTSATNNYATATTLRVKNGGTAESYRSYVAFDVPALPGPVTGAQLRMFVADATPYGGHLYPVTAAWTETGVTWANGPAPSGPALANIGNAPLNTWVTVDLPASAFDGPAGRRSFLLRQDVSESTVYYSSRETLNRPRLTLTVSHPPGNGAPVARDDVAAAVQGRPTSADVLANDEPGPAGEAEQTLAVDAITSGPAHGTAAVVADGADAGRVRYTPASGYLGPDRFTYRVCDDGTPNRCDEAAVDVAVVASNDPPVARDDAVATDEDTAVTANVLANDDPGPAHEPAQALRVDEVTPPSHGTAEIVGESVRYTPEHDFHGGDSLEYRVCDDGSPALCATGTLRLAVAAVNDAPSAGDDALVLPEDGSAAVDVLAGDAPGPPDEALQGLAVAAVTIAPEHGSATVVVEGPAAGRIRYTPAADYNGADGFRYRVCDDGEPSLCATAAVAVAVEPVNDAPAGRDDAATLGEDDSAEIPVLAGDSPGPADEAAQRLTVDSVTGAPEHGSAEPVAGGVRYTPDPDYNGRDRFSYRLCDDGWPSLCATAGVDVTVEPVNDAPVAGDYSLSLPEDSSALVPALSGDTPGPEDEWEQGLTFDAVTVAPEHGSARISGEGPFAPELSYTPHPDYNGPDAFSYRFCDDGEPSMCSVGSVVVSVEPVNDAPRAGADALEAVEAGPTVEVAVLPNDSPGPADESWQSLTLDGIATPPAHGLAAAAGDRVGYTPDPDFFGTERIDYRVCDTGAPAECSIGTVDVAVAGVNDPPLANADALVTPERDELVADLVANDKDGPGGESLHSVKLDAVTAGPAHGSATVLTDGPHAGKVRYTADGGYYGADAFVYRVCEDRPDGLCATARAAIRLTISATVETQPVPRPGDAADDAAIWVNPTDGAGSVILGTDKQGGIATYALSGAQIAYRADGRMNNVDIRDGFPLDGREVALAAMSNLSTDSLALYRLNPATRSLEPVAARRIEPGFEPYGLCMYHSRVDGRFYAFITSRVDPTTNLTAIEQWELFDDGSGKADARRTRRFSVEGEAEGCVADDLHGDFYLSEEMTGIWKYGAEPDAGEDRTIVDAAGDSGQLNDDVEGLTIAERSDGTGLLIASSQGDDGYAVYEREGENDFLRSFRISARGGIDGTEDTDGVAATTADLGPAFPHGLLVVHDGINGTENQNFKLVPLDAIGLPADQGGGSGCTAPYSGSSPWNTRIHGDVVYEAGSDAHIAALEGKLSSDPTQYTYPVYRVDSTTPRQQVTLDGWLSAVTDGGTRLVNQRRGTVALPLPDGALAADGDDSQIVMVDPQTGEEWGASQLERGLDGNWIAWNAYKYNTGWDAIPPRDSSERPFFPRGAGVPYLTGLVRPCEILRGRIDHALAFAYDYATFEYVFPATKSDGNAWDGVEDELDSHAGDMPEGAHLQLDPSITPAEIRSWGCTGPCMVIARALQEYGMFIIDNAGRPKVMLEYEGTAVWDGTVDAKTPNAIPLSAFKLIELPPRQSG